MKLSELDNRNLFNYMLFYNKMTDEEKNKINFVVYKNHLMYLKENNTEKYNYYYTFLEKMLYDINTSFDKKGNIEINSINDIVILFNSIMKIKNDFFESSLEQNNILTNNGLCPLVLYAFNNIIYKVPVTENDIKKIIEFSLMGLYRVVTFKNSKLENLLLLNDTGAISNIYLNKNIIIKYPKTVASKLFLMQQEMDAYNYLSKTELNKFLPENYTFDTVNKSLMHSFVNGENGEYYLFNHIPFTKKQIYSLKLFYSTYSLLFNKIILDIHPGNFIWCEEKQQWIIIDLGVLPTIGKEYYEFETFEEYFDNIWLKREETMKKIPIRSLDLVIDLDVKDKVLKYE